MSRNLNRFAPSVFLLTLITATALSGCSKSSVNFGIAGARISGAPDVSGPDVTGPHKDPQSLQPGETSSVTLSNGADIVLQRRGEKLLYRLEGTFTSEAFSDIQSSIAGKPEAERREILKNEIEAVFKKASKVGAIAQHC